MSADEKVMREDVEEDTKLESLGYQQELKRSFGLLGMVGFAFSIVTSWTALGGVLIVGVESGGPPVMYVSLKYYMTMAQSDRHDPSRKMQS